MALEVGMAFLKARRAASEVIAEAERLAREFVMGPDQKGSDLLCGVVSREAAAHPTSSIEPSGIDLDSLASQVDEIEATLLGSHQRIRRLVDRAFTPSDEAQSRALGALPLSEEQPPVPAPMCVAGVEKPAEPAADAVRFAGTGGGMVALEGLADPVSRITEPFPDRTESDRDAGRSCNFVAPATHGPFLRTADPSPMNWGPPDPTSRVHLPTADQLHAPPAGQPVLAAEDPQLGSDVRLDGVAVSAPAERGTPPAGSGTYDRAAAYQPPAAPPLGLPAAEPAKAQVDVAQPAKGSSTLWLLNVVGFSALLIVVVVVLMLANVL